jgi:hypothetical protein
VARIDAPLLDDFLITFLYHSISDTTQIAQFIGRTPNFEEYYHAKVVFSTFDTSIIFLEESIRLELRVLGGQPDVQLSSLVQVCTSFFPRDLIATLKRLYILSYDRNDYQPYDDIEISRWLDLLRPFIDVWCLYIHSEFVPYILLALQQLVGQRVTEVLPALSILFFGNPGKGR